MKAFAVILGYYVPAYHHYGQGSGDTGISIFIIVVFIAIVIVALIIGAVMAAQRRKDVAAAAAALGMQFAEYDPFNLPGRYASMRSFDEGHSKSAYNTIYGKKDGLDTIITDYKYTVGSGKNSHTYRRTYCLVTVASQLPALLVRPEGFLDHVAAMVGFNDINFESAEFNNAFHVTCDDRRAAYDLITQKMMEFLLQYRGMHLETLGNTILVHYNNTMPPAEFIALITIGHGIARRLPAYTASDDITTREHE